MTQPHQIDREAVLRPIVGIENRTAQEVFDIMCDRIRRRPAPMEAVAWREKIDWLRGEHDLLSGMGEGEFACSARERAEFEADRAKANAIFDAILTLIATHPVQGGEG